MEMRVTPTHVLAAALLMLCAVPAVRPTRPPFAPAFAALDPPLVSGGAHARRPQRRATRACTQLAVLLTQLVFDSHALSHARRGSAPLSLL